MMDAYPLYKRLVDKLTAFHRKEVMQRLLYGILTLIQWVVISSLLIISAEALFHFNSRGRLICLVVEGILLLIPMIVWILPPLIERMQPRAFGVVRTAKEVGAHLKAVNDRLANALELIEKSETQRRIYSLSLIEESLKRTATELEQEDFTRLISSASLTKGLRNTGIVVLAALVFFISFQAHTNDAVLRLLQPQKSFADHARLQFFVSPGDLAVLKGDPVELAVVLSDTTLSTAELVLKSQSGTKLIPLKKAADDTFHYQVEAVRDTLLYFFRAKEQTSSQHNLYPVERPFLRSFKAFIQPPAYSRRSAFYNEDNVGDVSALKGSLISLSGFVSKAIEQGYLQFSDSVTLPLKMQSLKFNADFTLVKDDRYSFHLIDAEGYQNSARIQYRLNVIPDNFPFVDIVIPGKDVDLNDDMILPLAIQAQDDFGISKMRLAYQVLGAGLGEMDSSRFVYRDIQGYESNSDQIRVLIQWDLNAMDMFPEDVLLYFVEAFDNDAVSGPKKGSSKIYRARFPSLYEMYEQVASEQNDASANLEQVLDKGQELQQQLEKMSLELAREEEIDWQQKNELEQALQNQQAIEQQMAEVTQKMDELVQQIKEDNLFSTEMLKKFEEIQQLFQEIMTPELQQALEKMNEALKNMDEEAIREAIENFKLNVQDYNKTLDRTIALLKNLKLEQQLEQAQHMAQDLAERQQEMTKQSQQPTADADRLSLEQQKIAQDAEGLKEMLQQLQEDMQQAPPSASEPLNQAAEQMNDEQLAQNMQQLENMLQQGQFSSVPPKSMQAQNTFEQVANNLDAAKQAMSGEMQARAMKAMRKNSRDLLGLSKSQEELMQKTQDLGRNSSQYPELAEQQQEVNAGLRRVMNEMLQVLKNNFGIDPGVGRSLGHAMNSMEQAVDDMEARESGEATHHQGQAMSDLNEAVRRMSDSMQSMMQQGGSGGMSYQQFLQQMNQLGDAQSRINQQTENLSSGFPLTPGQQAAIARLAAEQREIRKSMETLAKEAAGMGEILGSLENIGDEMKKVEQDFAAQNITRDTIQRQNRILSRMLDAQKSINKREFSRERQAETGKYYQALSPNELPADFGEQISKLQQDLLRAKKEGFTRDYLQVIEKYFKALTEHESSQPKNQ